MWKCPGLRGGAAVFAVALVAAACGGSTEVQAVSTVDMIGGRPTVPTTMAPPVSIVAAPLPTATLSGSALEGPEATTATTTEPFEYLGVGPPPGSEVAVNGVAFHDGLVVREGPSTELPVVTVLDPTASSSLGVRANRTPRTRCGYSSTPTASKAGSHLT
jgi:hypothetical protein